MEDTALSPKQSLWQAVPACPRIFGFIIFNVISFQIALGTPLVLVARHWGASPFYIGAITSLVPLLATLQLYMGPRVEYIGFRRVMLSGWTGRNVILILTTMLPFCAFFLSRSLLLEALFVFMILYNILRGLASTSWLPWLIALVPESMRGRYFSFDQFASYISSAIAFFFCGWVLGDHPGDIHFGVIFAIALLTGWVSLYFLKGIDSPLPKKGIPAIEPFPVWARRIWKIPAFRRLIRVNALFSLATAAWEPFTTLFLKDNLGVSDRNILYIIGLKTLVAVVSAWGWGILADRFGSRPIMAISTRILLPVMICWLVLALGLTPTTKTPLMAILVVISVIFQVGVLGFTISNFRYCMNNAARDYPVLALTLFSVLTSVINALAPNLWGLCLSAMEGLSLHWGPLWLTPYSFFYIMMILCIAGAKFFIRKLPDQQASSTNFVLYHMITDYPLRTINAVYGAFFNRPKAPCPDED